ncbi:MAG: phosphoribosylformylglycinamidine synthase I [Candidatus Heimdallarchaeaceae archaeon]
MRIGITKFPGTNNEQDVLRVLRNFNVNGELIYPLEDKKLQDLDALVLAGGFSYGDYLRPGGIAAQSPVIEELKDFEESGKFIIGICNGFQILCETKILPGVLTTNLSTKFICKWIYIKTENVCSPLLQNLAPIIKIPIAHYKGRYYHDSIGVNKINASNSVAFRYCNENGEISEESNPNGSLGNIAGLVNTKGNILGMMPHPERASFDYLGSDSGRQIFENLIEEIKC